MRNNTDKIARLAESIDLDTPREGPDEDGATDDHTAPDQSEPIPESAGWVNHGVNIGGDNNGKIFFGGTHYHYYYSKPDEMK